MSEIETSAERVGSVTPRHYFAALPCFVRDPGGQHWPMTSLAAARQVEKERDEMERRARAYEAGATKLQAERDALAARLEKAEGMAEALAPFADDYRDMWSEEQNDGYRTSDAALVCDGSSGINVGDLRTAVTALAAWRAAQEVGDD